MTTTKRKDATGSVRHRYGRWEARVRVGDARPTFRLPTCSSEPQALARLGILTDYARRLEAAARTDVARDLLERLATREGVALEAVKAAVDAVCAGRVQARPSGAMTLRQLGEAWTGGELAKSHPDHIPAKDTADTDRMRLDRRNPLACDGDLELRFLRGLPRHGAMRVPGRVYVSKFVAATTHHPA